MLLRTHSRARFQRSMTVNHLLVVLGILLGIGAAATPSNAGESIRLGTKVVPTFQFVSLRIDADETDYDGNTRIELRVREATDTIRLHADDMPVQQVVLRSVQGPIAVEHETGPRSSFSTRSMRWAAFAATYPASTTTSS